MVAIIRGVSPGKIQLLATRHKKLVLSLDEGPQVYKIGLFLVPSTVQVKN